MRHSQDQNLQTKAETLTPLLSCGLISLLCLIFFLFFYHSPSLALSGESLLINSVHWEGIEKTDLSWIESFTGLHCPCLISEEEQRALRSKLLTTQVFQDVVVYTEADRSKPRQNTLHIKLKEKWTIIPVIRGALGGGTPLLVMGLFDTHAFGNLLTLGAESRIYGKAKPGGVAWMRAPRWHQGRHYLNIELWRDVRIRNFYDATTEELSASLLSSATYGVAEALFPLDGVDDHSWQYGVRVILRQQDALRWDLLPTKLAPPLNITLSRKLSPTFLVKFVYDDIAIDGIQLAGIRSLFVAGPRLYEGRSHSAFEHELFAYKIWTQNWNLSWHHWLGMSDDDSYQSLFFLGGFDSIRGLRDGTLYGNKAAYTNLELRKLIYRAQFAWWQVAAYTDYGSAGPKFSDLGVKDRLSIGTGLRVAIPQVNRLVLRFDYAWGVTEPRTSSISVGMNQFIDPYRPL